MPFRPQGDSPFELDDLEIANVEQHAADWLADRDVQSDVDGLVARLWEQEKGFSSVKSELDSIVRRIALALLFDGDLAIALDRRFFPVQSRPDLLRKADEVARYKLFHMGLG